MDPLSGYLVGKGTDLALARVRALLPNNDAAFLKMEREVFDGWIAELALAQKMTVEDLLRFAESAEQRLNELKERLDSYTSQKVQRNYIIEAGREPTEERRRMLAHANAAVLNLELTEAQNSRVERVLRELDPDDVLDLKGLDMVAGGVVFRGTFYNDGTRVRYELWTRTSSADILTSSGCIRLSHRSGVGTSIDEAVVTRMGRLVLQVLRTYLADRQPRFDVPGREHVDGSRSQEDAAKVIDGVNGLRNCVLKARTARYQFPKWSQKDLTPPPPNGKGALSQDVSDEVADEFEALKADASVIELGHGKPCDGIGVRVHRNLAARQCLAEIHGPHDVLRHLADEIDARWV